MDAMRLRWVLVAVLAALLVRLPAITSLPIDWDEPIYMAASAEVAETLQTGEWSALAQPSLNREHPMLVKLVYGSALSVHGSDPTLVEQLASMRGVSLLAGLCAVALVAWVNPAAGVVLATHTIHAKYSTQAYLDSLPVFWMAVAMIVGWRSRARSDSRCLLLAGACWGAAMAGKWLHGLPGFVLLAWLPGWRVRLRFGAVAAVSMLLLDPSFWPGPWARFMEMVSAHRVYAAGLGDPSNWWTPWAHLTAGGPAQWHPEAFPVSIDGFWLVLAGIGLWLHRADAWARFLGLWFGVPMLLLMAWDTRWPQHVMVGVVPLSLAAGLGIKGVFSLASRRFAPIATRPPASE